MINFKTFFIKKVALSRATYIEKFVNLNSSKLNKF